MSNELHYFPLRGRGEVIRLALAAAGVDYKEVAIDYEDMKANAGGASFPFGQAPTFHHDGVILAQMDAILRFVGRLHNLYGDNAVEQSLIDMVLIGVEGLRGAYGELVYQKQFSLEAKASHLFNHIKKENINARNGGNHFSYLENILSRNNTGFAVGNRLSIADIQLFDLVDLHLREGAFPEDIRENCPLLAAHHDRIAAIPNIAEYLASEKRHAKVNGNGLG